MYKYGMELKSTLNNSKISAEATTKYICSKWKQFHFLVEEVTLWMTEAHREV